MFILYFIAMYLYCTLNVNDNSCSVLYDLLFLMLCFLLTTNFNSNIVILNWRTFSFALQLFSLNIIIPSSELRYMSGLLSDKVKLNTFKFVEMAIIFGAQALMIIITTNPKVQDNLYCRVQILVYTYNSNGATVLVLIKLTKIAVALRSVNWCFEIISSFFAKFKNVVHSLEPGETPSNSASHQAPNYVQRS